MMFKRCLSLLLISTGTLVGLACDPPPNAPAIGSTSATPTASASASAQPKPAPSSSLTGVLSEDAFKKLHEMRASDAPEPRGEMVKLSNSAAYLSLPPNAKPPLPAVMVIHEWWGLNQHIKHWADRLAADGYAALAVDLYGGKTADKPDGAMALVKAVDTKAATAVVVDAAQFLKTDARVQATRRASIGWCFGGKWSLQTALAVPDMSAAIVYYGHVSTDAKDLAPLQAPLLGVFGNKDTGIPPKTVDAFEPGLNDGKKTNRILRYDAAHAFANPSSARYNHESAEKAWAEVQAFLKTHLKGQ